MRAQRCTRSHAFGGDDRLPGADDKARHQGKQTLILIVDERPDISDMLSQALAIAGYRVTTTAGEAAWVERIKQSDDPPALVLLDLSQAPGDAVAYLADLRARWQTPPPLLVMTTSKHIYHELTAAGEPVLQKPFHIHQLFAEVQKLLPQAAGENSDSAR